MNDELYCVSNDSAMEFKNADFPLFLNPEKAEILLQDYYENHSLYLDEAFNHLDRIIKSFERCWVNRIRQCVPLVDTLIGTGFSGSLVVPVLARKFRLNFALLRKEKEKNTSIRTVEGKIGRAWIFIDDLTDTKATWHHVVATMREWREQTHWQTDYKGAYWYRDKCFDDRDETSVLEAPVRRNA